jgi:hypothetical protein
LIEEKAQLKASESTMDDIDSITESGERQSLNEANDENKNRQNHKRANLKSLICYDTIDVFLKV